MQSCTPAVMHFNEVHGENCATGAFIVKIQRGASAGYYGTLTAGEPLKDLSVTSVQERPCPSSQAICTHIYSHLKPILHEITGTWASRMASSVSSRAEDLFLTQS